MKTAEQWLADKDHCERQTSPNTGNFTTYGIEAIQADALEHATMLLTAHADSQQAGFEAVYDEMLRLRGVVRFSKIGAPNGEVSDGGPLPSELKPKREPAIR